MARILPILTLAVLLLSGAISSGQAAARMDQMLPDGWKFIKDDAGPTAATDSWQSVTIPHTWNTKSADDAPHDKNDPHFKSGYWRGACWYSKSLDIPAGLSGKRVFIRFEAASLVARTFINGQLLGEHRGGFTAFCYELTPYIHFGGKNELRVQVDNSHQEDVAPLSGDFNVDGGIYRPVHLIVTDPVCISPLDMASPGVYLTTKSLNASGAEIEVKTILSNSMATPANLTVLTQIKDADGKPVVSKTQPATVQSGTTTEVLSDLSIPSPHLWNGRKDPYLYTATVSLVRGPRIADSIQQPLGLRTVAISEDQGFLLNGQPYPIHGVNRHQDWDGQGWAATPANYNEDMQMMLDMGVTAIRLTHYPQSDYLHNLCDHNGILLWNEVSLVNEVRGTPEFAANAQQQLRELILQRYNHPSCAFWGLFNELGGRGSAPPDDLLRQLKAEVQELDPSRLIVCAIARAKTSYNQIPDHPCFNFYPGWYQKFGLLDSEIKAGSKEVGKRIALSEYGAGSNAFQHEEGPLGPDTQSKSSSQYHPEEWQTFVHEADWAVIKDNPLLWGSFLWVMFDFQVSARHEGSQPHTNDKGMVTEDRKTKKDAYYFYQANWTDKPMVHIASSGMTPRRLAATAVEVFSNCDSVELTVNGNSLGSVAPDNEKVFRWQNVTLQPGVNQIKVVAKTARQALADKCTWVLDPATAPPPPNPGDFFKAPAPKPSPSPAQ